ncbi:hypothetical protein J1614_002371 [Plenodomus biglobosus]|nr:hypothetical protein J1614_002371 [Plenodomus biglobosus]
MRKSSFRFLVLSLFGSSTAQTSSQDEAFTVKCTALSTATPTSTDSLLPIKPSQSRLDNPTSLPVVPLISQSVSGGILNSHIQSVVSKASFDASGSETARSAGVQSTAAAEGMGRLRKMGLAGALGGAAGVLVV